MGITPLYDPVTQQPVDLGVGQNEDAFLNDKVAVKGDSVNLTDPEDNKVYQVPSEKIADAINAGFQFETPDQGALREVRAKFRDNPLSTGISVLAGSFANEALLGVPEIAQKHAWGENSLQSKAVDIAKEENPLLNDLGHVTGFAAQLLYGGPLWKGLGLAGDAAANTATNVARVFGKDAAESYIAKVAAAGAKGATEGALISLPVALTPAVTDVALGRPEDVGQDLVAAMGHEVSGAFVGGALFGGARAIESPVGAVLKSFDGTLTSDNLKRLGNTFQIKQFGGWSPEFGKIMGMDTTKSLEENMADFVQMTKDQGLDKVMSPVDREALITAKTEALKESMNSIRKEATNQIGESLDLSSPLKQVDELTNKFTDDAASLKDIRKAQVGIRATIGQIFYDKWATGIKEANEGVIPEGSIPVWPSGEQMIKGKNGMFILPAEMPKVSPQDLYDITNTTHDIAYPKSPTANIYDRPASTVGGQAAHGIMKDFETNSLEGLASESTGTPLKAAWLDTKKNLTQLLSMDTIFNNIAKKDAARSVVSLTDAIASSAGSIAGGPLVGLGSGILNYMRRRYGNQLMANTFYKSADMLDALSSKVSKPLVDSITGAITTGAAPASVNALTNYFSNVPNAPDNKPGMIAKLGSQITNYMADSKAGSLALQAITNQFTSQMPSVAGHMNATIANGIGYLNNNIPKPQISSNSISPAHFSPTDREISQFERKLATVMNPVTAIEDAANGILTKDQVDALLNVYPGMLRAVRTKITKLVQGGVKIPAHVQASLKLLMQGQSVSEQGGPAILLLQENFMHKNPATPGANTKITIDQASRVG